MATKKTTEEVPERIQDRLPEHAQHIYKEAYKSAKAEYANPDKRRERSQSDEEVAHKVAWSAVKKEYKKQGEEWVKK